MPNQSKEAQAETSILDIILLEAESAAQKALENGRATVKIDPNLLTRVSPASIQLDHELASFDNFLDQKDILSGKPYRNLVSIIIQSHLTYNPKFTLHLVTETVQIRHPKGRTQFKELVLHRRDTDEVARKTKFLKGKLPQAMFGFNTYS